MNGQMSKRIHWSKGAGNFSALLYCLPIFRFLFSRFLDVFYCSLNFFAPRLAKRMLLWYNDSGRLGFRDNQEEMGGSHAGR